MLKYSEDYLLNFALNACYFSTAFSGNIIGGIVECFDFDGDFISKLRFLLHLYIIKDSMYSIISYLRNHDMM